LNPFLRPFTIPATLSPTHQSSCTNQPLWWNEVFWKKVFLFDFPAKKELKVTKISFSIGLHSTLED
jgi:hypothetical protein